MGNPKEEFVKSLTEIVKKFEDDTGVEIIALEPLRSGSERFGDNTYRSVIARWKIRMS